MALIKTNNSNYKRDKVEIKYLNEKDSQITNIKTIAEQLGKTTKDINTYLKSTLNTQMKDDILSGKIELQQIESAISKYIDEYILCAKCHLPELNDKNVCMACHHVNHVLVKAKIQTTVEHKIIETKKVIDVQLVDLDGMAIDEGHSKMDYEISNYIKKLHNIMNSIVKNEIDSSEEENYVKNLINLCWSCNDVKTWNILKEQIINFIDDNTLKIK